ncbi:MAG: hypothetical protein IOD08_22285, partial [Bradyrhizobium sp.]|uniref:hypothetical protein n=1 Tax=Bradyrhizobium sp. TaxID=376 RepID=UPI0025BDF152
GRCGPAFPSICYRTTFARELFGRPLSFGKYTDVDIVLEFTRRGLWMSPKPLFVYCHHGANDSAQEVPVDRARLTAFLRSELLSSLLRRSSYRFFWANVRSFIGRVVRESRADG